MRTIYRRIRSFGLFSYHTRYLLLLTPAHTAHVARFSLYEFEAAGINILPWRSPDFSPIEHVDVMGRRLTQLRHPPQTLEALRHEVQLAWDAISQPDVDHLIRSMPRRVNGGLRGGHTHC